LRLSAEPRHSRCVGKRSLMNRLRASGFAGSGRFCPTARRLTATIRHLGDVFRQVFACNHVRTQAVFLLESPWILPITIENDVGGGPWIRAASRATTKLCRRIRNSNDQCNMDAGPDIQPLDREADAAVCAAFMVASEPWTVLGTTPSMALSVLKDPAREVYVARDEQGISGFVVMDLRGLLNGYIQILMCAAGLPWARAWVAPYPICRGAYCAHQPKRVHLRLMRLIIQHAGSASVRSSRVYAGRCPPRTDCPGPSRTSASQVARPVDGVQANIGITGQWRPTRASVRGIMSPRPRGSLADVRLLSERSK